MLDEFALGEPHLHIDLAARLFEQALALGGGLRGDALFFGGDLFGAARAQGVDLARQRLQLAIDLGELRRGRRLHVGGLDEILANRGVPIAKIGGERVFQEPPQAAGENREVDGRPQQASRAAAVRFGLARVARRAAGW